MVFRILRPDSVSVWNDEEILRRFSKYRGIIDGTYIARYLIAKTIECKYNSNDSIKVIENLLKGNNQRKGSYSGKSGTLNRKDIFCKKAISYINKYNELSKDAQKLIETLYIFIKENNY